MKTDVAIIGAGPTGLFAAFQCGMLGMNAHIIDALPEIGGQCAALYPEKPIYDIPAYPHIEGGELVAKLEAQVAPFAPKYHLGVQVVGVDKQGDGRFQVMLSDARVIDAGAVIIAAGAGAFGPNKPPIAGLDAYEGKSVFYMVRRKSDFAGKRVVIAGGGDSAVDWAVSLADVAEKVYVVHRRDAFRAAGANVARMKAHGNVEMVVPYQLKGIEGDDGMLTGVQVATLEGEVRLIEADVLLPFYGLAAKLGPIAQWGLGIENNTVVVNPVTCESTMEGVYAVGDVAQYAGKLRLILTGFAEGANAAHAAWKYLHPHQELHMEFSTGKGVPGVAGADIGTISV